MTCCQFQPRIAGVKMRATLRVFLFHQNGQQLLHVRDGGYMDRVDCPSEGIGPAALGAVSARWINCLRSICLSPLEQSRVRPFALHLGKRTGAREVLCNYHRLPGFRRREKISASEIPTRFGFNSRKIISSIRITRSARGLSIYPPNILPD